MGAMGRFLAERTTEQRDRVISASVWCAGGAGMADGSCLMEHALGGFRAYLAMDNGSAVTGHWRERWNAAGWGYDFAVTRFEKDRVVRAVKLRAARLNGAAPEQIAALLAQTTPTPTKAEVES